MAMRLPKIIFRMWPVHIFASVFLAYSNGEKGTMDTPDAVQVVKGIPETFLHSSVRNFDLVCVRMTFRFNETELDTMEQFIVQEDPMPLPPTTVTRFVRVNETKRNELLVSRDKDGKVDSTLDVLYSDNTSCMVIMNSIDPNPCALYVSAPCFGRLSSDCIENFQTLCGVTSNQTHTYNNDKCRGREVKLIRD